MADTPFEREVERNFRWNFSVNLLDISFGGEPSDLDRAHRELGGRFELGVVYTMIAGLLNILAVYDAYEGPAYEDEEDENETDKPPPDPNVPPPS